jgi:hypothetical protein
MWKELILNQGLKINFAHQTFNWDNEAKGKAAIHVVIVGFAADGRKIKKLFTYEDINGEPSEIIAKKINPYLVEGDNIFIETRGKPIHQFPKLFKGSQPTDGNNLILTESEKEVFELEEPQSMAFIRPYIGGAELMKGTKRYCLWLKKCPPKQLKEMPMVMERLRKVSEARLKSKTKSVREYSKYPSIFTQDRQPDSDYLAMPRVSSQRRAFIPIAYLSSRIIAHEKLLIIPNASIYLFGILMSTMHNSWVRLISGRMKSDISYSPAVYNNFPFPTKVSQTQKNLIESKAQAVLDVRASFPESSLADLYDPLTMPPELVKAHQALDKAVDKCYRSQPFPNERKRIEFLFELYAEYTEPLLGGK